MEVREESLVSLIDQELMRTYLVTRNGKKVRVTTGELICDHVTVAAAKGSKRALKLMLRIQREWKDHPSIARLVIQVSWGVQQIG